MVTSDVCSGWRASYSLKDSFASSSSKSSILSPSISWILGTYFDVYASFNMTFCGVDDQFVSKVGMTFNSLEDVAKFYKDYSKVADFSTRVWCTNKKGNEIKNQLITCSREEKWKSKISLPRRQIPPLV
ncbi:hypothetical protein Ahy_B10g102081 [Arachis hypogaea]|uniref:FAR1 domain-containing protein n=1 Tax=Arachis hypogaea TaxID=3818 RepID=A0A444X1A9_ARAHY|nr:hypothetical protein Ahy_B10g102081 [Arachis hypogaea]